MMPEMDGFELIDRVRQNPSWAHVPIVVATATDISAEDRQRLNGLLARVLRKSPRGHEELVAAIRQQLRTHEETEVVTT
jgi:CheY-like chemotaxis protein